MIGGYVVRGLLEKGHGVLGVDLRGLKHVHSVRMTRNWMTIRMQH